MPGPSGIDLLHGLMQSGSAPPILFLTARDDVMTSVDAMKQGAFDYIVKPASAERVISVVARALQVDAQRTSAQRELRTLFALRAADGYRASHLCRRTLASTQQANGSGPRYLRAHRQGNARAHDDEAVCRHGAGAGARGALLEAAGVPFAPALSAPRRLQRS